ncbi:MAG: glycosyltransferase family 2 protein [Candidatus Marinimicrobia bacterium]|nr:glycosyltransferase family 2 protein [Candidatus Neomarinimicrobiota bacterium]
MEVNLSRPKLNTTLSLIIPTRDRAALLKKCLQHLADQIDRKDEILVVDNGSQDDTHQVVLSFQDKMPVKYFFESRKGPSFARNLGIKKAKGKILGFLDDDMIANKNWVKEVKKLVPQGDFVYAGKVKNIYFKEGIFTQMSRLRDELFWPLILKQSSSRDKRRPAINFLGTGNFCLQKEVSLNLKKVFDEKNFPFIGEQQDLAERLQLAGFKIIYNPKMITHHQKKEVTLKGVLVESFIWGKAMGMIEKKYQASSKLTKLFFEHKKTLSLFQKLSMAWRRANWLAFFLFFLWETSFSLGKIWGRFQSSVFKRT